MPRRLIICLCALATAELVARLVGTPAWAPNATFIEAPEWDYPHMIDRDAQSFWRYRPNQTIEQPFFAPGEYRINAQGFRGEDFTDEKPAGTKRVVCFGGSTTFGWGVAEEAAYPRQLEKQLNLLDPTGHHWQVINAGVTNYSTFQGLALAEHWLPRWNADIVLYNFSFGDHQPAGNGVADKDITMPPSWEIGMVNLAMRSRALQWVRRAWQAISPPPSPEAEESFRIWRVGMVDFNANIERLVRTAVNNGARPIIVTSPISWPPPGMTDTSGVFHYHHRYHRAARYASLAAGAEYAELANPFNAHPEFFTDNRRDNEHFNSAGHAFAGEFLAHYILGAVQDTTVDTRMPPPQTTSPD